jgi:competence ComEA-like helix-hairpin-helix protein
VLWATHGQCAKKKPPLHPVNRNTATSAELQQVPGIGRSTAEKILQARKSYGSFKSVNDLEAIRGIGPKKLEKMRKYLTVAPPPQNKTAKTAHPATPAKPQPSTHAAAKSAAPTPKSSPSTASEDEEP